MAMNWTRILCSLGTLAHNRPFAPREIHEYLRFEPGAPTVSPAVVMRKLRKHGLVRSVGGGKYTPTPKGWNLIERVCRR